MTSFGERARQAIAERGHLCVGIDPHVRLLTEWGLPVRAAGAREFALRVVDAARDRVGFVKPQVSFFERYGSAGYAVLEEVISSARAAGLIVIADAKRGDLGSTMEAYGEAWLHPESPLAADAVTLNVFQGLGVMTATLELANAHDKGAFVLAATSNPEGVATQTARISSGDTAGRTVSGGVVEDVSAWNRRHTNEGEWGSVGVVIGATVDWVAAGLPADFDPVAPILAPGFGFQGVAASELSARYGKNRHQVIASESRSILSAGPTGITDAVAAAAAAYATEAVASS